MSNGAKQTVTVAVGSGRAVDISDYLISWGNTNVRTNERTPGPGQITYIDTKHTSGTITFDVRDDPVPRRVLANLAGEVATVTRQLEGSPVESYQVNPMVTVNAAGAGIVTYTVTGEVLR